MAGDKDTLLSMGFDPARVECQHFCLDHRSHRILFWLPGALKATSNRGLQPAMDHILENESKPVPSIDSVTESSTSGPAIDVDDEDAEALESLGGIAANAAEAKVRIVSVNQREFSSLILNFRASSVQNVARYSRTRRWLTSTLKRVATINSKNPQTKYLRILIIALSV